MTRFRIYIILHYSFAFIWAANAIVKLFDIVPRHREIVARILGENHASVITMLIGCSELVMTFWILSRFQARLCAATQIIVIVSMNILENVLAKDILLYGGLNLVLALLLAMCIGLNETVVNRPRNVTADA